MIKIFKELTIKIKNIPHIFTKNKIKKTRANLKNIKKIRTMLSNYSNVYSWKYNLNIQNILNLIWQKKVKIKNISYKENFFFDKVFFQSLNLKYKQNVGEWKTSFFILDDLEKFLEIKWKYLLKITIFLIAFYVLFAINFFSNLWFAFTFYNKNAIDSIKQQYSNVYTRNFFLDKLKRK